ncbi:hypothetical protein LY78DRAFT_663413 [Colletotrichum sublineola]|nr:hypothetical protein LY78DRAFT_663413 [Colletotrichum sublineola]
MASLQAARRYCIVEHSSRGGYHWQMLLVDKLRCIVLKVCRNLRPRLARCTNNAIKLSLRAPSSIPRYSLAPSHSSLRSNRTNGFPAHRRRTTHQQRSRLLPPSQGLLRFPINSYGLLMSPKVSLSSLSGIARPESRMVVVALSLSSLSRDHAAALRQPGLGFFAAKPHLFGLGLCHGG